MMGILQIDNLHGIIYLCCGQARYHSWTISIKIQFIKEFSFLSFDHLRSFQHTTPLLGGVLININQIHLDGDQWCINGH